MVIELTNQHEMKLRGRIDRIDATKVGDESYLRIIDYKSSSQRLDLNDVYHGLSLQMLTYLDVAVENSTHWLDEKAEPGGVLYVHMHNPMLKQEAVLNEVETEAEMLKNSK